MGEFKICTVSSGAAGSKMFTRFMYPQMPTAQLGQYHGHYRRADLVPSGFDGFVFLFADPRNAVISFFQRRERLHANHGFHDAGGARAQSSWSVSSPDWVRRHLVNLGRDPDLVDESWGLEDYLANTNHDVFGLDEHFENWLFEQDRDVLFVRFESLWDRENDLKSLLNLTESQLPKFTPRAADWQKMPAGIRAGLNSLYAGFAERLEALPDIFGRYDGRVVGSADFQSRTA